MKKSKNLTLTDYAKHRGVRLQAVQDALKYGRITKEKDGKLDPVKADEQWLKNTNAALARGQKKTPAKVVDGEPDYFKSRAMRESYEAELAKLEFEEKSGKLIDADKVRRQAFEIARITRDAVLSIPDRISAELAGITDQATIHSILTKELNNSLQEIVRANSIG